jgi:catechol 2,3-dioxygenase-like lactoylglutathione lyase family enzyme
MRIQGLDHLVLTVVDIEQTLAFYTAHLGMTAVRFGEGRHALRFGEQKINLHPADAPCLPHALLPTPGSADLCFLVDEPAAVCADRLRTAGVAVESGPIARSGATGPLLSIYLRDPDGNLIELANPID